MLLAMSDDELLAGYWATAGATDVHGGREWSLWDWRDRCAHAERCGLRGLGLWHADLEHQLATRDHAEIRAIFEDHGLVHLEVELLNDWFRDPGTPERVAADAHTAFLVDAAARLGARHLKTGNIFGTPCDLDVLAERFGELCARVARDAPGVLVGFEVMPFDVNVTSLATALDLLRRAGAPANAGLLLDTWHLGKMGVTPDDLRTIGRERIAYVELSDGPRANRPDLVDETINHRLLPGQGELDLPGYVAVCREIGYTGPWGIEILSLAQRARPIDEAFDVATAATRDVLARA
jgi:sugar phosphate isomerase/epimerase